MAESGTLAEQLESFISNNQNVPELPEHEAVWSFSSLSAAHEIIDSQMVEFRSTGGLNIPNHQRAPGTVSSWPPNNWNWSTAPDFRISQKSHHAYKPGAGIVSDLTMHVKGGHAEDTLVPVDIEGDWIIEANTMAKNTLVADTTAANFDEPQMVMSVDPSSAPIYLDLEAGSSSSTVDVEVANFNEKLASVPEDRSLDTGTQQDASLRTGRLGEALVHKYFVEQLGSNNVKWVNQESETGLPYDIVITRKGNFTEYVEVKATVSSQKDWFYVTSREWQFALEKGDSFSFARVVLSGLPISRRPGGKAPEWLPQIGGSNLRSCTAL
ncbi:hypothetical protein PR202_gb10584 [Eleusine coracana subsp. coracana]|uniref:Protein NO VEIN C-terminal domain-containing protein n=1 Tax=Eleusine coracana subsp. coracana TaxID=191504 RepID=A0AAV5EKV0_ELECO|nr:hypothetical protein PR202_gb10584 [Eleusine coracana subsp. coracana]